MAVEARCLNVFPSQILSDRGMMVINGVEGVGSVYGAPVAYGMVAPSSVTTTATETLAPMYGRAVSGGYPVKTAAINSDSGLSYAVGASRKRSRDAISPVSVSLLNGVVSNQTENNRCVPITFLGEDFSFQFQRQQMEIDRFITQHTEKVRLEVKVRQERHSQRIAAVVEEHIMKRLKAKEFEIQKIGQLNWALAERVKSLSEENQIWRDLAQTNEATAKALRCNLEQVLAQFQGEQPRDAAAAVLTDDAQSSCSGNSSDITPWRTLAGDAEDGCTGPTLNRLCRCCGKEESCVLLLPCRHLCLCAICGSSPQKCPVCNSTQTATVHVNLSPP